jgi:hypothetical protein
VPDFSKPVKMDNWSVMLTGGEHYARIEENSLQDVCLKGKIYIEKPNGCHFCPYKNGASITITTSGIWKVDDAGYIITKDNHSYDLQNPHPIYARLFGRGQENLVDRLREIIKIKRTLM